jgi:hypothetical protein
MEQLMGKKRKLGYDWTIRYPPSYSSRTSREEIVDFSEFLAGALGPPARRSRKTFWGAPRSARPPEQFPDISLRDVRVFTMRRQRTGHLAG